MNIVIVNKIDVRDFIQVGYKPFFFLSRRFYKGDKSKIYLDD